MKKQLKFIATLIFFLILTISPLNLIEAKAATSNLTYVNITSNSRDFAYRPDPLALTIDPNAVLIDAYTFKNWQIPAGKAFSFYVNLQYNTNFDIIIIDQVTGMTVYNQSNASSFYIKFPAISVDNSYYIAITATSTNAYLSGWGGSWQ